MRGDSSSIGAILVDMGVISQEQLDDALAELDQLEEDELVGKLLLASGLCAKDQLEVAQSAQMSLRCGKKADQAMAVADLALSRKRRSTRDERIVTTGGKVAVKVSTNEFPVIGVTTKPAEG